MTPVMSSANMVKLRKKGCPMDSVESAQAWYDANANPAQCKQVNKPQTQPKVHPEKFIQSNGNDGVEDFYSARTRDKIAEANLRQIEEAKELGRLVLKTDVEASVFEISRAIRDGLTNCARRIAADVAGLDNVPACEEVIDREHRALMQNMVKQFTDRLNATFTGDAA